MGIIYQLKLLINPPRRETLSKKEGERESSEIGNWKRSSSLYILWRDGSYREPRIWQRSINENILYLFKKTFILKLFALLEERKTVDKRKEQSHVGVPALALYWEGSVWI